MGNIFKALLGLIFPIREDEERIRDLSEEEFGKLATPLLRGREKEGFIILFEYQDKIVKSALWEMKFRKNEKAVHLLASALYERLIEELSEAETFLNFTDPLLIPIPLSRKTANERGFNQCELLAKELEVIDGHLNFKVRTDILYKTRETSDQVGKTREERFKNLEGCFEVKNRGMIAGKNIILLDDIVTTGATLLEARKILRADGAKRVICLAVAH